MNKQRADIEAIRQEIAEITALNDHIQLSIDAAGTQDYIERTARDQLGFLKDNEIRFTEETR